MPRTFIEALQSGWNVSKENTVLGADKRHRHGRVILRKEGAPDLAVSYTASVSRGFQYGRPEAL